MSSDSYMSRPDIRRSAIEIYYRSEEIAKHDYYIFASPGGNARIYDGHGNLVWAAIDIANARNPHPCSFDGRLDAHLCFSQGVMHTQHMHGWGVVMDKHYQVVHVVQTGYGYDMHEFTTSKNGTEAVVVHYEPVPYDLSSFNVTDGFGWVEQAVFRRIQLPSHTTQFEWRSLDYVLPEISTIEHGQVPLIGNRTLDYFHLNSIDENSNKDYLISSRHLNAVFKISGTTGQVMWRLSNDAFSSFVATDFRLFGQHNVRWVSENATHTLLSLLNNGANTWHHDTEATALEIMIDHVAETAYISQRFPIGEDAPVRSFGSMQVLENHGVFTEAGGKILMFAQDGSLMLNASLPDQSYRTLISKWNGQPIDPPDIWAYAFDDNPDTPTALYVSWNGVTAVQDWVFYAGDSVEDEFRAVGQVDKAGFETQHSLPAYAPYVFVEARHKNTTVLGRSRKISTWIPSERLRQFCNLEGCPPGASSPNQNTKSSSARDLTGFSMLYIIMLWVVGSITLYRLRRFLVRGKIGKSEKSAERSAVLCL